MTQRVSLKAGAIRELPGILEQLSAESVFLVTGKASFGECGAEAALADLLAHKRTVRFSDFEQNPKLADAEVGLQQFRESGCDVVLAVGGGSVIDMAKLITCFAVQTAAPRAVVAGEHEIVACRHPLIAVPTTSGTGSEATHFAVVYMDGQKYSVAHPSLLPTFAVIDPDLTRHLPSRLTAITGLDAFAQAVESLWSVNSTVASREDSQEAISLVHDHLVDCVQRPTSRNRWSMSRASYLAGRAINITKTTAPHALSYTMTSQFGVPHGHAVALTLGDTLVFNSQVSERDISDPRGVEHVRQTMRELNGLLGCQSAGESRRRIHQLIRDAGLATRLYDVGITTSEQRALLVANVNAQRLGNNPRQLTNAELLEIVERAA